MVASLPQSSDVKEEDIKDFEKTDSNGLEDIELDPALDRAITRKFDLHIVPWLFGLWLLAFIVGFKCLFWLSFKSLSCSRRAPK